MSWQSMTIGRRITYGFGIVLALLILGSVFSYTGVGSIVKNATEVISGNKLDGNLAQKEVDHLNWSNAVNRLLTDDAVTELNVETDDHQCGFGKWLYGPERKAAEAFVPSLAPLFKEIEEPHRQLHASAIAIDKHYHPADPMLPSFLAVKESDHLKWTATIDKLFVQNLPELKIETDDHKCSLGQWLYGEGAKKAVEKDPDLASLIEALKEPHSRLHKSAIDIQKEYSQVHPGLIELLLARLDDHHKWVQEVSVAIIEGRSNLGVQTDPGHCAFGKFLDSDQAKAYMASFPAFKEAMDGVIEPHRQLHRSAVEIEQALRGQGGKAQAERLFKTRTLPALAEISRRFEEAIHAEEALVQAQARAKTIYETKTLPYMEETRTALIQVKTEAENNLEGVHKAGDIYAQQTLPALLKTQGLLNKIREEARRNIMTDESMLGAAKNTRMTVSVIGIVAIIAGIALAAFIIRGITSVLRRISNEIGDGADQVASASSQVSAASQQLAEGASEQAAAIEETSSSMEEMASMTRANADNTNQADALMKEAQQSIGSASEDMTEMGESMSKIAESGTEISKIVKSIDEIAFQTNLLALNAAVEAARAGEAGAGFAVVADEVRNLAMRAAEAAKNTQSLVEDTVNRIEQGSSLVGRTQEGFKKVTEASEKIASLLSEVASASNEQAQGIDQVNTAITQMDAVTQQVAANSEESASSSEELNAQAEAMKDTVGELLRLVEGVHGQSSNGYNAIARTRSLPKLPGTKQQKSISDPAGSRPREIKSEQAIPFEDDNDFSDF